MNFRMKRALEAAEKAVDALLLKCSVKHGTHNQSSHGRGGGGGSSSSGSGGGGESGGGSTPKPKKKPPAKTESPKKEPEHGFKKEGEYTKFNGKPSDPKGTDTEKMYMKGDPKGKSLEEVSKMYTPERQALHTKIVDSFFEGKTPVDKPESYMMGGGPASGKSTVIKQGFVTHPKNIVNVDSDAIKEQLPEYRKLVRSSNTKGAAFAHEESSHLSKVVMNRAVKEKFNTNLDGTGDSGIEKLTKKTKELRASGAKVQADYMTMDTELSWKIAKGRGAKTGRHVPEFVVRETHATVSNVLPKAMKAGLFDKITLWDNNINGKPIKVASGAGKTMVIHDKKLWSDFLKKDITEKG